MLVFGGNENWNRAMKLMLLLLLALPGVVQAQFTFTTNNGAITITGYTGTAGAVKIPAKINGLRVTGIGDNAFFRCYSLTNITIPNSVRSIGFLAFGVSGLTQISIPNKHYKHRRRGFHWLL